LDWTAIDSIGKWLSYRRRRRAAFVDSGAAIASLESFDCATFHYGLIFDSAEKVYFRKSEKKISNTNALYRTIEAWLIIFFIPNFCE